MSGEKDDGPPKPRKKRLVMIGGVLVLGVVLITAWMTGSLSHLTGHRANSGPPVAEKPVLVDLPDIVSNLDTGGRRPSFVKVHAKVEVSRAADAAALQAAMPEVLDLFQTYLRSTRPDELRDGEGTYRLREALMNRIDATLAPVQVTDLLFTELLVQ